MQKLSKPIEQLERKCYFLDTNIILDNPSNIVKLYENKNVLDFEEEQAEK